jgi:hypothetical protein
MGCLLVILGAIAPRLLFVMIWIARPEYVDAVFTTWVFPLLGVIFLPFTTLLWLLLDSPPVGVHGLDWLWIGIAVVLDLGHYAGTYRQRDEVGMGGGSSGGPTSPTMPTGR